MKAKNYKNQYTIPLTKPFVSYDMKNNVIKVLDSYHLTEGPVNKLFEKSVIGYCDVKHAISVPNCTIGLSTAIKVLCLNMGKDPFNAKIIVPAFTHPATILAILGTGCKPIVVDINPKTLLIDYAEIEKAITKETVAILPVSLFGNPLNYYELNRIKNKFGIGIIEDAACGLGSEYNGLMTGSLADISVFSFHPRKIVTTGEGGMITTNSDKIAEQISKLKNFKDCIIGENVLFGSNYKLSDIQASIGLAQMDILDRLINYRIMLQENYREKLKNIKGVKFQETTSNGKHSCQTFCIQLENRNKIMAYMRDNGIEVQIGTDMIKFYTFPTFVKYSRKAYSQSLALPLYYGMTNEEQQTVVNLLKQAINQC